MISSLNLMTYLGLHEVPCERDSVSLGLGGIIFIYREGEEFFGFLLGMIFVEHSQGNGSDLEECNDDNEEAVGRQEYSGLLDGAAVAKKTDDEDKCTSGDENVSTLLNHGRLCQLLQ